MSHNVLLLSIYLWVTETSVFIRALAPSSCRWPSDKTTERIASRQPDHTAVIPFEKVKIYLFFLDPYFEMVDIYRNNFDDWRFTTTFVHMVGSNRTEAKSKMKHPSDTPTPSFELGWLRSVKKYLRNSERLLQVYNNQTTIRSLFGIVYLV